MSQSCFWTVLYPRTEANCNRWLSMLQKMKTRVTALVMRPSIVCTALSSSSSFSSADSSLVFFEFLGHSKQLCCLCPQGYNFVSFSGMHLSIWTVGGCGRCSHLVNKSAFLQLKGQFYKELVEINKMQEEKVSLKLVIFDMNVKTH